MINFYLCLSSSFFMSRFLLSAFFRIFSMLRVTPSNFLCLFLRMLLSIWKKMTLKDSCLWSRFSTWKFSQLNLALDWYPSSSSYCRVFSNEAVTLAMANRPKMPLRTCWRAQTISRKKMKMV